MELKAEGVSHRFFRETKNSNFFYAVKKTDFELKAGTLTEITGRSGSGKTTFPNILSGLLKPTEGKVLLDGRDIYSLDDTRCSILRNRSFGVIPQGQTAVSSLSVLENVLLPWRLYEKSAAPEERAEELLQRVGISELRDARPKELSGGELRRLSIARALIIDPDIIFADEPTGDLDDENTIEVLKLLKRSAEEGKAVLLVTHENEAEKYADRIYRMNNGELNKVR